MDLKRLLAGGSIVLTGLVVAAPTGRTLLSGTVGTVGLLIALFGVLVGLALVVGGVWVARSDLVGEHVLRVAGWNLLGVVALGSVLVLISLYPGASLPGFTAAVVLGVSAVAHVLIGINDVRRIRARELAQEREKLAVLNRLTRHNLRNDTQVVVGLAEALEARLDDPDLSSIAADLADHASDLAGLDDDLGEFQTAVERADTADVVSLPAAVEEVVDRYDEQASIDVDVSEVAVRADDQLETAIDHLVANAVEHAGENPVVTVTAREEGSQVVLSVADDGPGISERERGVLVGERDITQLDHGSGLGLWTVKAIVEAYDGEFAVRTDEGTTVELGLPAA